MTLRERLFGGDDNTVAGIPADRAEHDHDHGVWVPKDVLRDAQLDRIEGKLDAVLEALDAEVDDAGWSPEDGAGYIPQNERPQMGEDDE